MSAATVSGRGSMMQGPDDEVRHWARRPVGAALRESLQRLLLLPITRWVCRPLRVLGREGLSRGPYVFVANHTSHCDTALLLTALPRELRVRLAPGAAADYFFSSRFKAALVRLLTGAFPFPRRGCEGIQRARALLSSGSSVLLFPEGTRSRTGRLGEFKPGVGLLAREGAAVVPVGLAGPRAVLPKGARLPQQAPCAAAFGRPRRFDPSADPEAIAARVKADVEHLVALAQAAAPDRRRSWYERVQRFAWTRTALVVAVGWGIAEAIAWPVIPDFLIAPIAAAAPARGLLLAGAAVGGSVAGGALVHHLASAAALPELPLVTERMASHARVWMESEGAAALWRQPLSGIPYKAFAYQAGDAGVGLVDFALATASARGARIGAVAGLFALAGAGSRRWLPRIFGMALVVYALLFGAGLAATVRSWS